MHTLPNGETALGFIPTAYPAGVVLIERWDSYSRSIVHVTAFTDDVERSTDLHLERRHGYGVEHAATALITRAQARIGNIKAAR